MLSKIFRASCSFVSSMRNVSSRSESFSNTRPSQGGASSFRCCMSLPSCSILAFLSEMYLGIFPYDLCRPVDDNDDVVSTLDADALFNGFAVRIFVPDEALCKSAEDSGAAEVFAE